MEQRARKLDTPEFKEAFIAAVENAWCNCNDEWLILSDGTMVQACVKMEGDYKEFSLKVVRSTGKFQKPTDEWLVCDFDPVVSGPDYELDYDILDLLYLLQEKIAMRLLIPTRGEQVWAGIVKIHKDVENLLRRGGDYLFGYGKISS